MVPDAQILLSGDSAQYDDELVQRSAGVSLEGYWRINSARLRA